MRSIFCKEHQIFKLHLTPFSLYGIHQNSIFRTVERQEFLLRAFMKKKAFSFLFTYKYQSQYPVNFVLIWTFSILFARYFIKSFTYCVYNLLFIVWVDLLGPLSGLQRQQIFHFSMLSKYIQWLSHKHVTYGQTELLSLI